MMPREQSGSEATELHVKCILPQLRPMCLIFSVDQEPRGSKPSLFPLRPLGDVTLILACLHFTWANSLTPCEQTAGLTPPPFTSGSTEAWRGGRLSGSCS